MGTKLGLSQWGRDMLAYRVLRRVFGPKREEVTGNREECIMRSLMICTPHQTLFE
jgi:hypothetical protein